MAAERSVPCRVALFWFSVTLLGDVLVYFGEARHSPAEFAVGILLALGALWMLGGDNWLRWERTTHDSYDRPGLWALIEAWDPDDWLATSPWEDARPR